MPEEHWRHWRDDVACVLDKTPVELELESPLKAKFSHHPQLISSTSCLRTAIIATILLVPLNQAIVEQSDRLKSQGLLSHARE